MPIEKKLKTFCPLPWNHISANTSGSGRVCCDGYDVLKEESGQVSYWKKTDGLKSYFNSKSYKKIRREMMRGERPSHCFYCFQQEDQGVRSMRLQLIDRYKDDIEGMLKSVSEDGSIDNPQISYIDMALGNKCNLKCRMCSPWASFIIGKDWEKMGQKFDKDSVKKAFEDKWFADPKTLRLIKEALPQTQTLFMTGGEPMLVQEQAKILEMIIKEGHADHILLRYNSNQTALPKKIIKLWPFFKAVVFNCSVEAYGELNDYIRYPSKWQKQEENIYFLDKLSSQSKNLEVYIHTTLQAYNVSRIPELLLWLRKADFKSLTRFPFFIWVKIPEWASPSVLPQKTRAETAGVILESLREHEDFFLNYNKKHQSWSRERIQSLREYCAMMKNDESQAWRLSQFIEQTKKYDQARKQSVLKVLPEFKSLFVK